MINACFRMKWSLVVAASAGILFAGCQSTRPTMDPPAVAVVRFDQEQLAAAGLSEAQATDVLLIRTLFQTEDYRRIDSEQWAEVEPASIPVRHGDFEGWYWPHERRLIESTDAGLRISPSITDRLTRIP